MKDNEIAIKRLDGDIRYYQNFMDTNNNISGKDRKTYKRIIKQSQEAKDLAILKERNISN